MVDEQTGDEITLTPDELEIARVASIDPAELLAYKSKRAMADQRERERVARMAEQWKAESINRDPNKGAT